MNLVASSAVGWVLYALVDVPVNGVKAGFKR